MRKKLLFCIIATLLISLTACGNNRIPNSSATPAILSTSIAQENLLAKSCQAFGVSAFPSNNGRGLYLPSDNTMRYYDFELGESVILCAQSGCAHADESCTAYLGNPAVFAEYHNIWYTIAETDDGSLLLNRIDPTNGQRRTVTTLNRTESQMFSHGVTHFSHGYAYVSANSQQLDANGIWQDGGRKLYQIHLESGEYNVIAENKPTETYRFWGASQERLLLSWDMLLGEPLDNETFLAQGGTEREYADYIFTYYAENTVTELRVYDLPTGEYTLLADSKRDGLEVSPDPALCYENQLIYQLNDSLYLYGLDEGTSRKLLSQKNIINYWLLDARAFYITYTHEDGYEIYHADMKTGISIQLSNQGSTESMLFSITGETIDNFIGVYTTLSSNGRICWISKVDFYANNYSNAQLAQ